jgi:HlyD family secretion protein
MDRPLDPKLQKRQTRKRVALAGTALSVTAFLLVGLPGLLRPSVSRNRIRTARVETGPVEASITASGTVQPEREAVLSSPVDARVVRILKQPGDRVKKGEAILELDLSQSVLNLEQLSRDLALKLNQQAKTRQDLEAQLADVDGRAEIKSLQLQSYRSQLARTRHLFEAGLVSQESQRQAELAEAQAAIELRQLEEQKKSAERSTRTQLEGLDLEAATLGKQRREAERQLNLGTTKADRDGVVTWVVTEEGATVHRGDVIARLADLSSFRVEATVSDVHARTLVPGLAVRVRVGNEDLAGEVAQVEPAIKNGVMTFRAALLDRSNALLRSNLRVDVLVLTDRKAQALRVQRGPSTEGTGTREVFVVRGDTAVRTPVQIGITGFEACEIVRGLQAGDEVIVSEMADYQHVKEVRIRQ